MELDQIRNTLTNNLREHLNWQIPKDGNLREVYEYSLFPTGKLFRPLLVWAIAKDFDKGQEFLPNSNHALLASCVEFHHAYSLLHDDLPSMDNDTIRRGKPCAHLAFNEWKALLAGDGLLNLSYQTLSKIKSDKLPMMFRLMGRLLGSKGLVQGQVLDLSGEMTRNFSSLVETHKLKTARLIQFSLLSSYLAVKSQEIEYRQFIDLYRLGHRIGIVFQLLDDLTELTNFNLPHHEKLVNPWINFEKETYLELTTGLKIIGDLLNKYQFKHLKQVIGDYYRTIEKIKDKPLVIDLPTHLIFEFFKYD
jgi:geranylgeranyl pyrophosphate synthase